MINCLKNQPSGPPTFVSYDVEINKIETTYDEQVKVHGIEADYQRRRDAAQAGIDWKDKTPAARLATQRALRIHPKHFEIVLTKEEARGYAIGARVEVSIRLRPSESNS